MVGIILGRGVIVAIRYIRFCVFEFWGERRIVNFLKRIVIFDCSECYRGMEGGDVVMIRVGIILDIVVRDGFSK